MASLWPALRGGAGLTLVLICLTACAPAAGSATERQAPPPAAAGGDSTPSGTAQTAPAAPQSLRVSMSSASTGYFPLYVAQERGLFSQRGLAVDLVATSGTPAIAALLARELDVAYTDGAILIRSRLAGADTLLIGVTTNIIPQKLVAHPSLQRIEDLRGKRLAITRSGSLPEFAARYLLRSVGLTPGADVALIQTGTGAEVVSSMMAGAVDAVLTGEPAAYFARKQGYVQLYDMATSPVEYPATSMGTLRATIDEQPGALRAIVGGLVEAIAWIKQNRAEALMSLGELTSTEDVEMLEATYEEYAPRFPRAPYPTVGGIKTALESIQPEEPRAAEAQPADFMDDRFVRELEDSGYIRQLYP